MTKSNANANATATAYTFNAQTGKPHVWKFERPQANDCESCDGHAKCWPDIHGGFYCCDCMIELVQDSVSQGDAMSRVASLINSFHPSQADRLWRVAVAAADYEVGGRPVPVRK